MFVYLSQRAEGQKGVLIAGDGVKYLLHQML